METTGEIPAELTDDSGTICADVACRRCGYNLRGLHRDGRCPECGTAIGLSCLGDLLRFADPAWVETLGRGASLILWGLLALMLSIALAIPLLLATGDRALVACVGFVGGLLGFYGAWLITRRDPSGIGEDKYVTDRRVVRFALLVGLFEPVLQYVQDVVQLPGVLWVVLVLALLLTGLIGAVGEFAKLTYFRKLALRIPDDALANRARVLRWVVTVSLVVTVGAASGVVALAGGGGGLFAAPAGPRGGGPAVAPATSPVSGPAAAAAGPSRGLLAGAAAFGCIAAVAFLVFVVASIVVLFLVNALRKAFREQARVARETWAAAESLPTG